MREQEERIKVAYHRALLPRRFSWREWLMASSLHDTSPRLFSSVPLSPLPKTILIFVFGVAGGDFLWLEFQSRRVSGLVVSVGFLFIFDCNSFNKEAFSVWANSFCVKVFYKVTKSYMGAKLQKLFPRKQFLLQFSSSSSLCFNVMILTILKETFDLGTLKIKPWLALCIVWRKAQT